MLTRRDALKAAAVLAVPAAPVAAAPATRPELADPPRTPGTLESFAYTYVRPDAEPGAEYRAALVLYAALRPDGAWSVRFDRHGDDGQETFAEVAGGPDTPASVLLDAWLSADPHGDRDGACRPASDPDPAPDPAPRRLGEPVRRVVGLLTLFEDDPAWLRFAPVEFQRYAGGEWTVEIGPDEESCDALCWMPARESADGAMLALLDAVETHGTRFNQGAA